MKKRIPSKDKRAEILSMKSVLIADSRITRQHQLYKYPKFLEVNESARRKNSMK